MPYVYDPMRGGFYWMDQAPFYPTADGRLADTSVASPFVSAINTSGPPLTNSRSTVGPPAGYTSGNINGDQYQFPTNAAGSRSSSREPYVGSTSSARYTFPTNATGTRSFEEAKAASSAASGSSSSTSSSGSTSASSTATGSSTSRRAASTPAAASTTTATTTAPRSNITRSSDGLVTRRNGRRIDSNGNLAFSTSRSPEAMAPVAPLPPPSPQPNGAFGFGTDPFTSGQVPLPPGQFYPTDVFGGDAGAYGGMPWMQQAQGNYYGGGAGFLGGGVGAFPGAGNNASFWPNLTDPQVQRNLAVLNAQFPWQELQESTRRDNRNFFEQARNNLFNRRAQAFSTASRASLPNVREIG